MTECAVSKRCQRAGQQTIRGAKFSIGHQVICCVAADGFWTIWLLSVFLVLFGRALFIY